MGFATSLRQDDPSVSDFYRRPGMIGISHQNSPPGDTDLDTARKDRLDLAKALLGELVAFPTVSSESNLYLIAWAAARMQDLGAQVDIHPNETGTKANLFATFGPMTDGGIVLSGHADVVPANPDEWVSDPFILAEREGRLYGRGTCDMKGFIACVLALAPEFARWPLKRPVHVALTYDEEVGCMGAQSLAETLRTGTVTPAIAIIGEPTSMQIVNGHKGCFEYTTELHGTEGHGSAPDLGVNAAVFATRYVGRLLELADEMRGRAPANSLFDPPWTTVNIGRIQAGMARNVIAGHAEIEWEMRPVSPGDADYIKHEVDRFAAETLEPEMRAVSPDAHIARHTIAEIAGLNPRDGCRAVELATALTGGNGTGIVAFGTEAGLFQALGVDSVVCGPGSIEQAHKPDEYIEVSQMDACLTMLARLETFVT
jgi:acetylornithine deacetylase